MTELTKEDMLLAAEADAALAETYAKIDAIALKNTDRVMRAFAENRISEMHFQASTGYGYDDPGREAIEKIYAEVFGTEAALVRHTIVNGTQALIFNKRKRS